MNKSRRTEKRLKAVLDRHYAGYDFAGRIVHDPIEFPRRYADPCDAEVAGLIASCLAYGRVDLFKGIVEKILGLLGKSPAAGIRDLDLKRARRQISFKYRFNEQADILCLLFVIKTLLLRHGSLEGAFAGHYSREDRDTGRAIAGFVAEILAVNTKPVYGSDLRPPGFRQFFPSPESGSACKRLCLFLRWMVRDRDIDLGIWRAVPKDRLVIPLDTHIARIGRCLGLTQRKSSDWRCAVEITESLRRFDPEDPLKYDFALCHLGISGLCKPDDESACEHCALRAK